ncbi:hypothetical protein ACFGOO_09790 [Treponema vincentii]|uniref:hypothetical protein n=1 Tax=Treponema vincentii TaxID=69710 RepID=UPI0035F53603
MKKAAVALLCVIILIPAFAETESLGYFGFQYGSYWEKMTKPEGTSKTWIGSPGLFYNGYAFFNKKNIGLFIDDSFLFPSNSSATVNGITVKDGVKDFDFRFLFQFGIGPAFRYSITNKLGIHLGAGFHISMLSANTNRTVIDPVTFRTSRIEIRSFSLGLGIMGDIGLKYDITNIIYFDIGSKLALEFISYATKSSNISANYSQWNSNYIGFHLSPYIGLGLKLPF